MHILKVVFPFRRMPKHLMNLREMFMERPSQIIGSAFELINRLSPGLNRFQNFHRSIAKLADVMSGFPMLATCKFVGDSFEFT
jgi:hypothetical protein